MRILVAEDEPHLAHNLELALKEAGYVTDIAPDGEEARYLGENESYDAAILDLGLPKLDGVKVLGFWRMAGRNFPVLVLTARGRWSDKLAAFNAGADDYLIKPFAMEEVIVRIKALIRRAKGHAHPIINAGPICLDNLSGSITLNGLPLKLTAQESRILSYFLHNQGRIISRTELYEHIYDLNSERDSNVLDVLIGRIRKKIGLDVIHTLRGQGYLWRYDEQP